MFADHFTLGDMTLSLFTPRKTLALFSYFPVSYLLFLSIGVYRTRILHRLRTARSNMPSPCCSAASARCC